MSDDKPLHVRVAEALGWTYLGPAETDPHMDDVPMWEGEPPAGTPWDSFARRIDQHVGIPRYDTDWSATGPLIERFGVEVMKGDRLWRAVIWPDGERGDPHWDAGPTPLVAICLAILKLSEAGKLDA